MNEEQEKPFRLLNEFPMRVNLYKTGEKKYLLLVSVHHNCGGRMVDGSFYE